jgi:hypothetical protein
MTMGGQKWQPLIDKEKEVELQKAKAAEDKRWRLQNLYASMMPSGGDRMIDWRSFGR